MNDLVPHHVAAPAARPSDPRFSSGPCRKHPGWNLARLSTALLGRSHRAGAAKVRLNDAITRSARLLGLPHDWKLGIVPGSDTGAFEMAMWALLGPRPVDVCVWESFSADWAKDVRALGLDDYRELTADYGKLPDLAGTSPEHDVLFVYNGTTSGVRVPNLDWVSADRNGLALCDATSAAYAMPIDFDRVDVMTWSWQKVLGGEAAHGMLALGPRAIQRLESTPRPRPLPKLFTLTKDQQLIDGIFSGATINTPSMLAVEDLHSALDWAEGIGGIDALINRSEKNFEVLDQWVQNHPQVAWLAEDPEARSSTSMCLMITAPWFAALRIEKQQELVKTMVGWLAEAGVAYDIANYRNAPPGFRIWGGATVEASDIEALLPWLDWALDNAAAAVANGNSTND